MQHFYKTTDNQVNLIDSFEAGSWINITDPTAEELKEIASTYDLEESFLLAALDDEESPRIESENGQLLIVVDIPIQEMGSDNLHTYSTMPLIIILAKQAIITITLANTNLWDEFIQNKIKGFYTQFKTRFVLQLLYRISQRYMLYLKAIERSSSRLEDGLTQSMTNKELLMMLRIQKSLVYLSTSLRANGLVLERLMKNPNVKNYQEDEDLLEDVIIENRQAISMADIYSSIMATTAESFANIISNNQNNTMKLLTSATIIMTIPTIISGLIGMNVAIPLDHNNGFWIIMGLIVALSVLVGIWFWKQKFF